MVTLITLLGSVTAESQLTPCGEEADPRRIAKALLEIEGSVDPCMESPEVLAVLNALKYCTKSTYQICTDVTVTRNVFDRPVGPLRQGLPRTITWNPELRSEIEQGCDGDPAKPVPRDPTASLLHELVHAAQDCQGLNPGEHEFEAVRVENIYRRAAGLCQRRGYGDELLPPEMVKTCDSRQCSCSIPGTPHDRRTRMQVAAPAGHRGTAASSGDAQLPRTGRGRNAH